MLLFQDETAAGEKLMRPADQQLIRSLCESLELAPCPLFAARSPNNFTVGECIKRGECGCDAGDALKRAYVRKLNDDAQADHDTEAREGWDT